MIDEIPMQNMQSTQQITKKRSSDTDTGTLANNTPQKSIERIPSSDTLEAGRPIAPMVPKSMAFKQIMGACVMLLVLFWANSSWLFGKIYHQTKYAHRLHVLVVDFDGGNIGQSLINTAGLMSGTAGEPTFDLITFSSNETYDSIYNRVREGGKIWGAIIANPKASDNLTAAVSPSSNSSYNAKTALTLVYNEARFRTVEIGIVYPAMIGVASATAANYQSSHGIATISNLGSDATDQSKAVALNPIGYTVVNMNPFGFSSSVLLNTVMFVYPPLTQFFAIMATNGILGGFAAYSTWSLKSNLMFRAILGTVFPCAVGLSWAGWVFIWGGSGSLGVSQYFLTWLTGWLFTAINFHVIDGTCSLIPMQWMPFFMLTAIITQVAAVVSPMELASNFYRIEYIIPSHHIWGVIMTIYGNGATNDLKVNLTVSILMFPIAASYNMFGNYTRWKKATAAAAAGITPSAH